LIGGNKYFQTRPLAEEQPIDGGIDNGQGDASLGEFEEGERRPFFLGVLDDDDVAGGPEDEEIAGDRVSASASCAAGTERG